MLSGGSFQYYRLDVSDFKEVEQIVSKIIDQHGRIDYLYNNAAVYPKVNFLEETAEEFTEALTINVCGISNLCKTVLPHMISRKFGRIFNIGSWAHRGPIENSAVYSCSKGAVHSLTKAIAKDIEQLDLDIEVHEWIPGHLNSIMSDFTGIDPAIAAQWGVSIAKLGVRSSKNCIFQNDYEWTPPKSLKQKIKSKLFFWKA